MRIALKELRREPGRFLPVGGALTMLVVLLVVLGGFLDGLELSQTGAYRAHEGTVLVLADDAGLQIGRSQVGTATADDVRALDAVADVAPLAQVATTAGPAGEEEAVEEAVEDVVLFGYGTGTDVLPDPPPDGGAVVDAALAERFPFGVGDVLAVGPSAERVPVAAVVEDLSQGSPTVWVAEDTWRDLVRAASPTSLPPEGTSQALVAVPTDDPADVAAAVAEAVDGVVAATPAEVIGALPAVQQQSAAFRGIIGVTFAVTLLVVALFFALITLERVGLYAVLKALGARSRDLLAGLSAQAVVIAAVALVLGVTASTAFIAVLPPELPIRVVPGRVALIAVGTVVTAVLGSLLALRRILAVDPADSIG